MGGSRYGLTPKLPAVAEFRMYERKLGRKVVIQQVLVVAERSQCFIIKALDGQDLQWNGCVIPNGKAMPVARSSIFFNQPKGK